MNRPVRIVLVVAAALAITTAAAVPATVPALAAATGPKGSLTATEYAQLTAEQVAFKKLDKKKHLTWNDFYSACHQVGQSTTLMQRIRSNCDNGVGFDQSLSGFYSDALRCTALSTGTTTSTTTTPTGTTTTGTTTTGTTTTGTGTTTTGTTTTGTGTTTTTTGTFTQSDLKLFACLEPEYAVLARAVRSLYNEQFSLRGAVLSRHFLGRCLLTLAPTTEQLHALDRFAATAKQLASDVALVSKVADGQASPSAIDGTQIENDSLAFSAAAKAFSKLTRPQNLTVCAHA